ncbi:IPT/TIG domain protein [Streptomyces sp. ADI92-24]|uniref:IPT/TIG domain-containing protein n=1 Tax=Streptomyces sp. ADI92-24 TaxID=1522756 RepID=UPI000F54EB16|nr:IPT/TIG domain-containing protein [Streptomyces sp. ADI92-24]RPK32117.1 IPT/TIG domain protein [Streptomyces sp. ADI92-24]
MNNSAHLPAASPERPSAAAVPTVSSLSPASGPAGTGVTATGTGFTAATAVRFGTTAATSLAVLSDTQLTVTTPSGSGSVEVTVTTSNGTSSQFVTYTYTAASVPVLSWVVPVSGPTAGGTTLTDSNLAGGTGLRFGATAATSFTVVSDTHITAVSPAGAGTVQVTVTAPGGTSPAPAHTRVVPPAI